MLQAPEIAVGQRMIVALAPLGDPETTDCTMRYTTPVIKVEEV